MKARDVDHFLPDLISSIEEILQGDFALLRSIAAGQKDLLTLGRAILKEIRKVPATGSEAAQRGHALEEGSSRSIAQGQEEVWGGSEQLPNSTRGAVEAEAEAGPVPEDDVHGALGDGEETGGERKTGKDKDRRNRHDDDEEYAPSSPEVNLICQKLDQGIELFFYCSLHPRNAVGDITVRIKGKHPTTTIMSLMSVPPNASIAPR